MALTCVQLVSLALMGVGCLVLMAGVASPVWERYTDETTPDVGEKNYMHIGLFYACKKMDGYTIFDNCKPFNWDLGSDLKGDDTFFKVVRVMMCQAVFFMLIGNIAGIVAACDRENRDCIAIPGIFNMLGAMGGISGVVTYAMWKYEEFNPFPADFSDLSLVRGWSFYMSCAACGFVLLVSLIGMCVTSYKGSYVLGSGCGDGQRNGISIPIYTTFDKNAKLSR